MDRTDSDHSSQRLPTGTSHWPSSRRPWSDPRLLGAYHVACGTRSRAATSRQDCGQNHEENGADEAVPRQPSSLLTFVIISRNSFLGG